MSPIEIRVTTMGFSVPINTRGTILGSSLPINDFSRHLCHWQFDQMTKEWKLLNEYFYFDKENERCYFPKYELGRFKDYLNSNRAPFVIHEVPPVEGAEAKFQMLPWVDYKNEKQRGAVEYLTNPESGPVRGLALQTGQGKGTPLDSLIYTPSGWVHNGDLKLGQSIYAHDGSITTVTGIYPQGIKDVYRLTLVDGRTVKCDLDHLWKVYNKDWSDGSKVINTQELINELSNPVQKLKMHIPVTDENFTFDLKRIEFIEYTGREETQCIMVDHPDHLYIVNDYIVTHNTVSAIWSLQKMGKRSLLSMTSRLEQWVSEICKYTSLEEDDVYVVQGVGSLTKLFSQIDKEIFPKFILASTRTMRLYVDYGPTYQHLPHPSEACERLGVGIVAGDESHESFVSSYLMTLLFNPKIFIPITATFASNDPFVKNIFNHVYPKDIQFTGGDYDRYVDVTSYKYTGGGYLIKPFNYTTRKMYSQIKFEDFLLSKKGENVWNPFVKDALVPIIKEQYINIHKPGEKLLILCATTALAEEIVKICKRYFPNKTASPFYSGMPLTILKNYDIIVSTPGSAGTGRDISGLVSCIVLDNTKSEIRNLQYIGRLRGPPQMLSQPYYSYVYFGCIPKHCEYHNARSLLYGTRAKTIKHRSL